MGSEPQLKTTEVVELSILARVVGRCREKRRMGDFVQRWMCMQVLYKWACVLSEML